MVLTGSVTLLPLTVVIVVARPPFNVYVKTYGAVPPAPVNVMRGAVLPAQIVTSPLIVAVGKGFTITVTEPDATLEQFASSTAVRV